MSSESVESLFFPSRAERQAIWTKTFAAIDEYFDQVESLPVKRPMVVKELRKKIRTFDFAQTDWPEALRFVTEGLTEYQTHFASPKYFGLFDPAVTPYGVAADAITAAFNPQLAASFQSAFAIEIEQHLLRQLGGCFGYPVDEMEGTFTSGGAEANFTALLCAIAHRFPAFKEEGMRSLPAAPMLYVSRGAHHSFHKAARMMGLGTRAVREIELDGAGRMDLDRLEVAISEDKRRGFIPFFVAGTVGTTATGAVDNLFSIVRIAKKHDLWCHADAAWGGAISLVPELRSLINGVDEMDSISMDAHKWLAVPMAAGVFLTRHLKAMGRIFSVQTGYLQNPNWDVVEPFQTSVQWSRRFIGLKLFLTLSGVGWDGYRRMINQGMQLGKELKQALLESGWRLVNETPLPVACFVDEKCPAEANTAEYLTRIAKAVVESGLGWISVAHLPQRREGSFPALRAGIVNFRTDSQDIAKLIQVLNEARG